MVIFIPTSDGKKYEVPLFIPLTNNSEYLSPQLIPTTPIFKISPESLSALEAVFRNTSMTSLIKLKSLTVFLFPLDKFYISLFQDHL